jgi:hypothetical protein
MPAVRFGMPNRRAAGIPAWQARENATGAEGIPLALEAAMTKTTRQKLSLRTQTIRVLTSDDLGRVVGGVAQPAPQGFIMKDTIIIRTSG